MNHTYNDTESPQIIAEQPEARTEAPTNSPIHRTLSLLFHEGDTIIVSRTLANSDKFLKQTFDSIDKAAKFAEAQDRDPDVTNIYVNLQQLKPGATTDRREDVAAYVRFLVDIDRKIKSVDGKRVMASDDERDALRKAANEVSRWVSRILDCHPLLADSGNGFHLCWNLRPVPFGSAIAPSQDNQDLYRECLSAIKQRFDDGTVEIDASISEPEQIIRLWGTHNRRSPETEGRPHRQSIILEQASGAAWATQLELLACEYHAPASNAPVGHAPAGGPAKAKGEAPPLHPDFDEAEWWEHYDRAFQTVGERDGWQVTDICPLYFEGEGTGCRHTGSTVTGFRFDRGQAEFHCFSDEDLDGTPHSEYSFGRVMKVVHRNYPPYPGKIWDWPEEDLSEFIDTEEDTGSVPPIETATGVPEPTVSQEVTKETKPKSKNKRLATLDNGEGEMHLIGIVASDVVPRLVKWLWEEKFPRGKQGLLTGKPWTGKTTLAIDLIARITTGREWPDGTKNSMGPKTVIFANAEDDKEDTLVPRLMAAGADLSRVVFPLQTRGIQKQKKIERAMNLKSDIKLIRECVEKHTDIVLLVLDPLSSYWGDVDDNRSKEIKPVMDKVAALCQDTGLTVIGLIHQRKAGEGDALGKVLGSVSIGGTARAVWEISKDPNEDGKYRMALAKGSVHKRRSGMTYSIGSKDVVIEGQVSSQPVIEWNEEALEQTADQLLEQEREQAKESKEDKQINLARAFLLSKLPMMAPEAIKGAKQEGIPPGTLYKAKEALNVLSVKVNPGSNSRERKWYLPDQVERKEEAKLGDFAEL